MLQQSKTWTFHPILDIAKQAQKQGEHWSFIWCCWHCNKRKITGKRNAGPCLQSPAHFNWAAWSTKLLLRFSLFGTCNMCMPDLLWVVMLCNTPYVCILIRPQDIKSLVLRSTLFYWSLVKRQPTTVSWSTYKILQLKNNVCQECVVVELRNVLGDAAQQKAFAPLWWTALIQTNGVCEVFPT